MLVVRLYFSVELWWFAVCIIFVSLISLLAVWFYQVYRVTDSRFDLFGVFSFVSVEAYSNCFWWIVYCLL